MTEAMPQLTLLYGRQMLIKESDIDGEEVVRLSAESDVRTLEAAEIQNV